MLSRVGLRGINAHSVSLIQPTSWLFPILLLGEQEHQSNSSKSRAISQKVGGLGNRTGDPQIPGPIP